MKRIGDRCARVGDLLKNGCTAPDLDHPGECGHAGPKVEGGPSGAEEKNQRREGAEREEPAKGDFTRGIGFHRGHEKAGS